MARCRQQNTPTV